MAGGESEEAAAVPTETDGPDARGEQSARILSKENYGWRISRPGQYGGGCHSYCASSKKHFFNGGIRYNTM